MQTRPKSVEDVVPVADPNKPSSEDKTNQREETHREVNPGLNTHRGLNPHPGQTGRAPSLGLKPSVPNSSSHIRLAQKPTSAPVRHYPSPPSTGPRHPPQIPPSRGTNVGQSNPAFQPPIPGAARPTISAASGRGRPRIFSTAVRTVTVSVEADAHLPCVATGEPKPFLSWTKVATGASVAQNTRIQRFEVDANGTLIIHKTLPSDRGQYMCSVQNQYGEDRIAVMLVVLSGQPRILNPPHRDVAVAMGQTLELECLAQGQPSPRVTWVLPSLAVVQTITNTPGSVLQRVALFSNGTLRINQASYADRGLYKCIASNTAGTDTVTARLVVSALPPTITQSRHENLTLLEGSYAYLHCSAQGAPPPAIRWTTPDNTQLRPSQFVTARNIFVFPNGTLFVRSLAPVDGGRYECAATNAVGAAWRAVNLLVVSATASRRARIMSSSSQRTDISYGTRLQLDCIATGDPEPRVMWRTPSKKLVDAQYSFDPRLKVFPNGTLTLHSVTEKDAGDYLCFARNKMGDDYVLLRVAVMTKPAKIERKLSVSQEVTYGSDLRVDCVASGLPNPKIQWALPDGTMVPSIASPDPSVGVVSRTRRLVAFDNGTLYFNEVGPREEGDYTCYAQNQLGRDEMRVRVKVVSDAPIIRNQSQAVVRALYGGSASLRCEAKGEPTPTVLWFSPASRTIPTASDKYRIHSDGTLVIQQVQRLDGGNYTCLARNSAGQARQVTRLEVMVAPPTINGLSGVANSMRVRGVRTQRKLLDCEAVGTPPPRVMWVLPENVVLPVPYYSSRMTVHRNGTLEIRQLKRSDAGQLMCMARSEGWETRLTVHLEVDEPTHTPPQVQPTPALSPRADTQPLTPGAPLVLNCSLDGAPVPHLTWVLPNGTPLTSGTRISKFYHRPDGTLLVSNPTLAEGGVYRCVGRSRGALLQRSVALVPGRPPVITSQYTSPVSILNGANLNLHCLAREGAKRLSWTLPSRVVLMQGQRAGRYAVLPNGTLSVTQASVYDRGSYVCRAANEYGSATLTVPVIVITYAPRITNGPAPSTQARRGVAVQLNCGATGLPRPEIAWETPDRTRLLVGSQPRLFGNKYIDPQGALIIQNPSPLDSGLYRCTARNVIGVDSKATYLHVF